MKILIGLALLLPALIIDIVLWIFGGWTKGSLFEMPCGNYVWITFLRI